MASKNICTSCLHALRQNIRADRAAQKSIRHRTPQLHNARSFSSRSSLFQQQQQQQPAQQLDTRTPVLPITTSTVTSIPTAAAPPAQPSPENGPASGPSSAEMQRAITASLSRSDLATKVAKTLRRTAKGATETYITYGLTENLFKACSAQADYLIPEAQRSSVLTGKGPPKTASGEDIGIPVHDKEDAWWFTELGLPPTFSTWSQVAYLHMYLLTVRLRALETQSSFQSYQRYLLEHFSHAAEDKMIVMHAMSARGIRNRYLKDLFLQWRGVLAAYDEGLVNGDAALGGAVWRNLYKGEENVDWNKVASVVAWMRSIVSLLGDMEIQELVHTLDGKQGLFEAGRKQVSQVAAKQSKGVGEPFV